MRLFIAKYLSVVHCKLKQYGGWLDQHSFSVATTILVFYCLAVQIQITARWLMRTDQTIFWDPMMISGAAACSIGLYFAQQTNERMKNTIRRLVSSGVVQMKKPDKPVA